MGQTQSATPATGYPTEAIAAKSVEDWEMRFRIRLTQRWPWTIEFPAVMGYSIAPIALGLVLRYAIGPVWGVVETRILAFLLVLGPVTCVFGLGRARSTGGGDLWWSMAVMLIYALADPAPHSAAVYRSVGCLPIVVPTSVAIVICSRLATYGRLLPLLGSLAFWSGQVWLHLSQTSNRGVGLTFQWIH
jgi:hypothetical protein